MFVESGILPQLVHLMEKGSSLEQKAAIDALSVLSFHDDNKTPIAEEKGCVAGTFIVHKNTTKFVRFKVLKLSRQRM